MFIAISTPAVETERHIVKQSFETIKDDRRDSRMMGRFDCDSFTNLTKTNETQNLVYSTETGSVIPKHQTLLLTVIDIFLEVHDIVGSVQISAISRLDNPCGRRRRSCRDSGSVDYQRSCVCTRSGCLIVCVRARRRHAKI